MRDFKLAITILSNPLAVGLLASALSLSAQDAKPTSITPGPPHPDFSGVWKLEPSLSTPLSEDPHAYPPLVPSVTETDQINHEEAALMIAPHLGYGDVIHALYCRTDGKGPQGPNASRQTRCDAHWEGSMYVFDTVSQHTTLTLSDDGKTLTKHIQTHFPNGTTDHTLVFEKISNARGGISFGDTIEHAKYQMGSEPDKVIEEGRQTILVYGDMDWVFIDGKMVNGVGGAGIGDRPPVYPDDVQFGWTKEQVEKVYHQPTKVIQLNGREIDFCGFSALAYSEGKLVYMSETGQTEAEVAAIFGQPSRVVEWNRKVYSFYPFMTATYVGRRLIKIGPSAY
jgi:hypothetical protein